MGTRDYTLLHMPAHILTHIYMKTPIPSYDYTLLHMNTYATHEYTHYYTHSHTHIHEDAYSYL